MPGDSPSSWAISPAGAPPVLQLVPALVAGGDDEPGLLPLRVLEGGAPLQALAEDGLGGVLRVGDIFQHQQTDLIDHLNVPPVQPGQLLRGQGRALLHGTASLFSLSIYNTIVPGIVRQRAKKSLRSAKARETKGRRRGAH